VTQPRIIFFGTPEIAAESLRRLLSSNLRPTLVVTQPAKPVGRHARLTPSPVEVVATKENIPVLTPASARATDFIEKLRQLSPDVAVLVAYGKILPKEVITIPKRGFVNVHPSVLPLYRGPSPIQSVILRGEKQTGVSIMLLDEKVDHGPVLSSVRIALPDRVTGDQLTDLLSRRGADLLVKTLPGYLSGSVAPQPQDHAKASFSKLLQRSDGAIDWTKSALEIDRMVRAYTSWPGTYTCLGKQRVKILEVELTALPSGDRVPGSVWIHENKVYIQTGQGTLHLKKVQPSGKQAMTGQDFFRGQKLGPDSALSTC
jgi:methionyl-tRNA formyltransferase